MSSQRRVDSWYTQLGLPVGIEVDGLLQPSAEAAPDALRGDLRKSSLPQLVAKAGAFRVSLPLTTPTAATKLALKLLARRYQQLCVEVEALDAQLSQLVA